MVWSASVPLHLQGPAFNPSFAQVHYPQWMPAFQPFTSTQQFPYGGNNIIPNFVPGWSIYGNSPPFNVAEPSVYHGTQETTNVKAFPTQQANAFTTPKGNDNSCVKMFDTPPGKILLVHKVQP